MITLGPYENRETKEERKAKQRRKKSETNLFVFRIFSIASRMSKIDRIIIIELFILNNLSICFNLSMEANN